MRVPKSILVPAVALAYPLAIYLLLVDVLPGWSASLLVLWLVLRAWMTGEVFWRLIAAGALALAVASLAVGDPLPFRFYPVLVNGVLLAIFGFSLVRPPSIVERIARLGAPNLPPEGVAYTRRVTQVWCGFFVFNGGMALGTALWASNEVWALYNGFVAYLLIGSLFGIEWLIRQSSSGGRTR